MLRFNKGKTVELKFVDKCEELRFHNITEELMLKNRSTVLRYEEIASSLNFKAKEYDSSIPPLNVLLDFLESYTIGDIIEAEAVKPIPFNPYSVLLDFIEAYTIGDVLDVVVQPQPIKTNILLDFLEAKTVGDTLQAIPGEEIDFVETFSVGDIF